MQKSSLLPKSDLDHPEVIGLKTGALRAPAAKVLAEGVVGVRLDLRVIVVILVHGELFICVESIGALVKNGSNMIRGTRTVDSRYGSIEMSWRRAS